MAVQLPYLSSNKNVPTLFEKIASAKIPDNFNHNFLQTTIGLKGSNDRALIPLLRNFGFLDQSNTPTSTYRLLKGDKRKIAWAEGIRKAYGPLFDADDNAHKLSSDKLKSLVSQVAGTDDDATSRIASTFSAVIKLGDFDSVVATEPNEVGVGEEVSDTGVEELPKNKGGLKSLRAEFQYNIQVQLPSNGTEETYLNIFNAIRKTFQ